nr:MAG TPA_asm: hypothetical protein [Caudoviricetes sp.]
MSGPGIRYSRWRWSANVLSRSNTTISAVVTKTLLSFVSEQ